MLFATLSAYGVVPSQVGPGVDREAFAHARRWRADFLGICNRGFLAFLPLEVIFRLGFVFAFIASLSLA